MKLLVAAALFLFSLPGFAADQKMKTIQAFPPEVLENYIKCRERTDLDQIRDLVQQHQVKRIDASIYGLPKDDLDDASLLTIEERLLVRREKASIGTPLRATGPVQYPHHLREALDQYYIVLGQRPDCNLILERAKGRMVTTTVPEGEEGLFSMPELPGPEALGSSWATDKNVNGDASSRGEVDIKVDFANQGRIMASSCPAGGGETSNHIARSTDYFATFSSGQNGNNSGSAWECDPVSYYKNANGNVFHSKIGCNTGSCGQTYTMMRRSTDNGATWADCARPGSGTGEDRQWHVVDNTATSPGYGNIYITWHNSNTEMVSHSTNASNCAAWLNTQAISAASSAITPDINVGRDGRVYVVWGNFGDSTFKIRGSNDQGVTWTAPSSGSTGLTIKSYNANWSNSVPSQCVRKVAAQPLVDVNRCDPAVGNCSQTHPGRIYVAMLDFNASCATAGNRSCSSWDTNWNDSCHYTIWLSTSDNNGTSWSTPVDLFGGGFAGLADGNNVDHIIGYMRVDEKSGDIYISYSRSKLAPAAAVDRQQTHVFMIRSTDGGTTWSTPYQISSMYGNERQSGSSTFERGDYAGFAVYNGVAWPVWIDRRNGTAAENIITRKVCSEPTHWSERGASPAAPPTNATATGTAGQVNVTWTAPDLFWGDGDESPASRKYQLWVDGVLQVDNILYTATSQLYTAADCSSHSYVIRAVNQCGVNKAYAAVSRAATGCCANNPTSVTISPAGPLTLCGGTSQTLTPSLTGGTGPFSYQWTRDGSNISGATSSTLTVSESGTHAYNVSVRGSGCSGGTGGTSSVSITWSGPPVFAGIQSVAANPQSTCHLDLSWNVATATCPGTITYSVYRSTSSGFTPAPANRIASGLTGTTYTDASGLASTVYYYVVRATSPGGLEETNSVQLSGTPQGTIAYATFSSNGETGTDLMTKNSPWALKTVYKHAGTNSYGVNTNATTYPVSTCAALETPALVMHPSNAATLSFWHIWSFESGYDGGRVEIQDTAVGTWNVLTTPGTGTLTNTGNACGFTTTDQVYIGNSAGTWPTWQQVNAVAIPAAYLGKTIKIRWRFSSDITLSGNQTNPGWYVDDIQITQVGTASTCVTTPSDVTFLTATAGSGTVKVEWMNPASSWTNTRIVRKAGSAPTGPTDGTITAPMGDITTGGANGHGYIVDNTVANGTTYYYGAYAWNGTAYSGGKSAKAVPKAPTKVTWAFNTSAAALTAPGIYPGAAGSGAIYVVSNDRSLHALNTGSAGGDWVATWKPMAMNAPSQSQPIPIPVASGTVGAGITNAVFVGSQDGTVTAVNGWTGSAIWASPWTSPTSGDTIQSAPMFTFTQAPYNGGFNFILVCTRNAGADNAVYALSPTTGSQQFLFNNGGGASGIGMITGTPFVDFSVSPNRLYFTSRKRTGGSPGTLWCLDINANSFSLRAGFPVDIGESDAGVNLENGRLYVGNNAGQIRCVNKDTGAVNWTFTPGTSDGPVKGFVSVKRGGAAPWRCFYSTDTKVWAVDDNGASAGTLAWSTGIGSTASPSYPLYTGGANLWVGGSDGVLYQLPTASGTPAVSITVEAGTTLGSPSFEFFGTQVYVGSNTGAVYAVSVPLP